MDLDWQRETLNAAIARVGQGEAGAMEIVYRQTSAKLFGICLRILGDASEAEDVLHEVYLTVWRNAGAFEASRASPITWLATIARNRAIDMLRKRRPGRHGSVDEALTVVDPAPTALAIIEDGETVGRLGRCLGELDDRQQAAVRRAFLDGRTYENLATEASVPLGTMKSWIRRALLKLRVCLEL